ncbi:MAG: Trm112 family protein [Alphaproteobacteria bacterium]|nr:Trm112 family protein [Alphaproteobacteria bacterium]
MSGAKDASEVDPKLLEILVCPLTKAPLRYDRAAQELISDQAQLAYPIRDGIPIMLVDEARPLGEGESRAAGSAPGPGGT